MVIKVTPNQLVELLDEIRRPNTSAYFCGSWTEKFFQGKITLSVKHKKKRVMLNGRIIFWDYISDQESSGTLVLKFVPNNREKADKFKGE
jgi:hypothetical protein